jgi:hypothetical protein
MKRSVLLMALCWGISVSFVFAGGGTEQTRWVSEDSAVYEGQSQVSLAYSGPTDVKARVYQNGEFCGSIASGDTVWQIIADGTHSYEIRPAVPNPSGDGDTEDMAGIKTITITALSNRISLRIRIGNANARNTVTELTQIAKTAITPEIRPQRLASGEELDLRLFNQVGNGRFSLKDTKKFTDDFLISGVEWDEINVVAFPMGTESEYMMFEWSYIKKNITREEYEKSIFNFLYAFHLRDSGEPPLTEEYAYTEQRKIKDGTTVFCKPGTNEGIGLYYNSDKQEGGITVTANVDINEHMEKIMEYLESLK